MNKKNGQQILKVAAVSAVALAMLWPALVNRQPFYMPDTPSYIRGADGAIHELTGATSAWSGELQKRFAANPKPDAPTTAAPGARADPKVPAEPNVVLKGRSIYYGLLLYVAHLLGNFWAMAIFQALLCAAAIALTVVTVRRALGRETSAVGVFGAGAGLAALTPVGYFVSYLLPDVFGGLGLLALGHLLLLWDENRPAARLFWFLLLAAALLFHASNVLLISALSLIVALGMLFRVPASKRGLGAVAVTLIIALLGQLVFAWGVKHATGAPPIRPPFLAARLIADGPGYDYLREHCPQVRLIYCRTVGMSVRDSSALLWSENPRDGIFQALPPHEQRLATSQQNAFVLAALKERPHEVLGSSANAFLNQLGYFKLESFNYTRANNNYFREKLPQPFLDEAKQSKAYKNQMPVRFVEWATLASVLAALAQIALAVRASHRREKKLTPIASFLLLLVLGVLVNAAICGAFSTPRGRYQMRLIWVLPLAALATSRVPVRRKEPSLADVRPGTAAAG